MPIGAHVSASGGLASAVARARAIGAECFQVFLCAPQQWREPRHPHEQVEQFGRLAREHGLGPNFAHAIYLINLASDDPGIRDRSIASLRACADWAVRCGLAGVVVHVGSGRQQPSIEAERNVVAALGQVLDGAGPDARILLENAAGSGGTLGATFTQLGALMDALGRDPRLGVCLDTAHAFAAGYDLRAEDGIARALDELAEHVSFDRLWAIHANDSRAGLGSAVDRHENIGHGLLGEEAFRRLLAQPVLADLPWLLEVPGRDKQGPDRENVDALKRLAGRSAPPV